MVGSFAYIGVTFFFLSSAYGLKYGVENKKDYLKKFWPQRLPKLLVPMFLINIVSVIVSSINHKKIFLIDLIDINDWVLVLLFFYLIFYIVYKLKIYETSKDKIVILIIIICSFISKLTPYKILIRWHTESIGFIYGILLYNYLKKCQIWFNKNYKIKLLITLIISLLLGILYLKFKPVYFFGDYLLKILLSFFLLILLLEVIMKVKLGNKALEFLGNISYEIYLFQYVSFKILGSLNVKFNSGIYIFLVIFITIIFSIIINKLSIILINKVRLIPNENSNDRTKKNPVP